MDVAGASFWKVVWVRNLAFFWCKVVPAGDEGCLGCAAGAAAVVPNAIGSPAVFCNEWCIVCSQFYAFLEFACRSSWNGWMNVARLCCHMRRERRVGDARLRNAL